MVKRAAIYDPYLDTLGGGERYCLTVAEILLKNHYQVDLFWSGDNSLVQKAETRFSLDLSKLNIVPDIYQVKPQNLDLIEENENLALSITNVLNPKKINFKFKNFYKKITNNHQYDIIFYLSDGSFPFLFGKKNFLHVQVPLIKIDNRLSDMLNKIKNNLYTNIICNSQFTAKFQKKISNQKVLVLYPPVDIDKFDSHQSKDNIILSVGRFDNILNAKKQDVLIDAFRSLVVREKINNWKLVLVGGSLLEPKNNSYLQYLEKKSIQFTHRIYY